MKKAIMVGAGQIGRGFIGMLAEQAGYHVVFADIDEAVIDDINARGEYTVHLMDEVCSETTVRNISAMSSLDPALIDEYAGCELILTAVGLTALPKLAPYMARGIAKRRVEGRTDYLNIIACENAIRASGILKAEVEKLLCGDDRAYMDEYVGFPDCAVDRIIPPRSGAQAADVYVERYHEWDVEAGGLKGEIPDIPGMESVEDLTAYLERKLFTLNGPNAVTACFGWLKGYETINESLGDEEIYAEVLGMMEECGAMLEKRHGFSPDAMKQYRTALMKRFVNPYIIDSCARVAREPIRKLSPNDRITLPMTFAHEYGIETPHYYTGIAAVLLYDNPCDSQSQEIKALISELGVRKAYEKIGGVNADSHAAEEIEKEFYRLKSAYMREEK